MVKAQEKSCKLLGTPQEEDNQQLSRELIEDSDYVIYNDGRLFSKKTGRFLTGKIDNGGYRVYRLAIKDPTKTRNKRGKMLYAHRLVATYFLDNSNNLPVVNHKDGNKLNNHVNNLEWTTYQENSQKYLQNAIQRTRKKPKYYGTDLEGEEWKIIPSYERYSVSNLGRVRNNQTNRLLHFDGIDDPKRYLRVDLTNNVGKSSHHFIHRLVYCVFANDFLLDGFVIDHINHDRHDNRLCNLRKVTLAENNLSKSSTTIPHRKQAVSD